MGELSPSAGTSPMSSRSLVRPRAIARTSSRIHLGPNIKADFEFCVVFGLGLRGWDGSIPVFEDSIVPICCLPGGM